MDQFYTLSEKPLKLPKNLLKWFSSLESARNINDCQCILVKAFANSQSICHEEGKEDQLDELNSGMRHQKPGLEICFGAGK